MVAVLDSGLAASALPAFGSRVLPGYDFISDPEISNDEDGRDANPLDPGDFDCGGGWHGTHVASIALADPMAEFSGLAYNASLLNVRVLGKCKSGYASDVADALVWSVGGTINGLQRNAAPAKVVVMSFAGIGNCPSFLQTAVDLAVSKNVSMFAAAGNDPNVSASESFPGNCRGVISVGATGSSAGKIASYSAKGADVYLPGTFQ